MEEVLPVGNMEEVPSFNFGRKFSLELMKERTCISFIPPGSSAPLQKKESLGCFCQPAQKKAMYQEVDTAVKKIQ